MAEFSTGVTTLLARMDTNPNEFFDGAYKWSFINAEWVNKALTEAEQIAIDNKLTEVRRIAFDQMVMQTLLDSEAERESRLGLKGKMNTILTSAQMAQQGSSLVASMTKSELQQMRALNQQNHAQYANAAQNIYPGSWVETK